MPLWKLAMLGIEVQIELSTSKDLIIYTFRLGDKALVKCINIELLKQGRFQSEDLIAESAYAAFFEDKFKEYLSYDSNWR